MLSGLMLAMVVVLPPHFGATKKYNLPSVGVSIELHEAFQLQEQHPATATAPASALFSNGLEILSMAGEPAPLDKDHPDSGVAKIFSAAQRRVPGQLVSSQVAKFPPRGLEMEVFTFQNLDGRVVAYYLPGKKRSLLITMQAPPKEFFRLSFRLEVGVGTLKVK
jgi:hypothetical protein